MAPTVTRCIAVPEPNTMSDELASKACIPCRGGVPPLPREQARDLLEQLVGWRIVDDHHLHKTHTFADFASALSFVNSAAAIAEQEQHHPDLHLAWGRVAIDIWTHKVDGLTESDFILAAKLDTIALGS